MVYNKYMNKVKIKLILLIAMTSIPATLQADKPAENSRALNAELCMKRFVGVFDKISETRNSSIENGTGQPIDFSYDSFFRILRVLKASIESKVCALESTYLGDLSFTGSRFDQDCKKRISGIFQAYRNVKNSMIDEEGLDSANKQAHIAFEHYQKICDFAGLIIKEIPSW